MIRLIGTRPSTASIRHATFLVNAILAGLIGYAVANLFWRAVPTDNPSPPPVSMETTQRLTSSGSNTGEQLAAMHLLGRAAPLEGAPLRQIPVDAPETRLALSLRGLLHHSRQEEALAIISASNNGQEKTYRVGDNLPGGTSIHAIQADRVILLRNGRHETLTLPKDRLEMIQAPREEALETALSEDDDFADAEYDEPEAAGLSDARRELLHNPDSLSRYVQFEPHSENGAFVGFRLHPGQDESLMKQSGLEAGDVVVSIAGNRLNTPEAGMLAMQQIAEAESIELELLRNGTPQTIHLDLSN